MILKDLLRTVLDVSKMELNLGYACCEFKGNIKDFNDMYSDDWKLMEVKSFHITEDTYSGLVSKVMNRE